MKVITVLGTRPEIIRLSLIMPILDGLINHQIIHTGQNYNPSLSSSFFTELGLRDPDYLLDSKSDTVMNQIGKILVGCEEIFSKEKPDRVLILGDTNSGLSAIVAKRMGIPVFHMEAGNRCYDDRVPEEVNRKIIDHSSFVLMPYTERSRANLLEEGIASKRIYVTGNPIGEILKKFTPKIEQSEILKKIGVTQGNYFLVTLHRSENVDSPEILENFILALHQLQEKYRIPVVCSVHPRTQSQLKKQGKVLEGEGIIALDPLGLIDFVNLEKNAACVLSDSGTVQEECAILKIPNITLRTVTERPETLESGSNFLTGSNPEAIILAVETVLRSSVTWTPPIEYMANSVSETVVRILLSHWQN